MERIDYEGYVIQAAPYPLADGSWSMNFYIEEHTGDKVTVTKHFAENTYKCRDEAVAHCLNAGRQVIDRGGPSQN